MTEYNIKRVRVHSSIIMKQANSDTYKNDLNFKIC